MAFNGHKDVQSLSIHRTREVRNTVHLGHQRLQHFVSLTTSLKIFFCKISSYSCDFFLTFTLMLNDRVYTCKWTKRLKYHIQNKIFFSELVWFFNALLQWGKRGMNTAPLLSVRQILEQLYIIVHFFLNLQHRKEPQGSPPTKKINKSINKKRKKWKNKTTTKTNN